MSASRSKPVSDYLLVLFSLFQFTCSLLGPALFRTSCTSTYISSSSCLSSSSSLQDRSHYYSCRFIFSNILQHNPPHRFVTQAASLLLILPLFALTTIHQARSKVSNLTLSFQCKPALKCANAHANPSSHTVQHRWENGEREFDGHRICH